MMASKLPHDVSPFLQRFRNFLLGREHISPIRFPGRVAARTQPPPNLPDGCNSKLANNYYYTRDGRRLVNVNDTLFVNSSSRMMITDDKNAAGSEKTLQPEKAKTPGKIYLPPMK